jgi:endonuclease/exonuclease/phosphatase family metal-dependent hydrolase
MDINWLVLFAAVGVCSTGIQDEPGELRVKVLSFNIRYGTANDGENAWPRRRDLVFEVLRSENADFCGLQEALRFQIDEIREAVPGSAEYGRARGDGGTEGEYSAILYRADRWQLDRGDTLWLSDTPRKPGSTSWGNSIPRIVTWGRFVEKKSGRALYVFNSHFDHRSQRSRVKSAKFIAGLIAREAVDAPVVLMGDFNAGEDNPAIAELKQAPETARLRLVDTFRALHPRAENVGTFNGFEGWTSGQKIDYVMTVPSANVESAEIVHLHQNGRYPSDHFPVSAEIVFPATGDRTDK